MSVRVEIDDSTMAQARRDLAGVEDGLVRAYSRALNKTVKGMRTDMVKFAREDYNFKSSKIRSRIAVTKSTWSRMQAKTISTGGGMHLTDLTGTRATKTGIVVNVKKSTGTQRLKHAFIKPAQSSGKLVAFWRARRGDKLGPAARRDMITSGAEGQIAGSGMVWRSPIVAIYAPSPEIVYDNSWGKLSVLASNRLKTNFAHEVEYVKKRYA